MELINIDKINKLVELDAFTLDSVDFLSSIINPSRVSLGESAYSHAELLSQIEDEFSDEIMNDAGPFKFDKEIMSGVYVSSYVLNQDQMILVGMRGSKKVRRLVLEAIKSIKAERDKLKNELISAQCATIKSKLYLEKYNDTEDSNLRNAMVVSNFRMLWESGNMKLGLKSLNSNPHLTNFLLEAVGYKEKQ